jgi:hypothetical protein
MLTRPLTQNDNFDNISQWLKENIQDHNSIKACPEETTEVPDKKGIYFWFMHPDAYRELSNYVPIHPVSPRYSRIIDGVSYDLVYLGTAGTAKKGQSNMNKRLIWHIQQAHTPTDICHGTLSTLRAGLGALLSEDLILPNTEVLINSFICQFMNVFYLDYSSAINLIDNDEKILIQVIKPLLNIKNNPNAKAIAAANPTQVYKKRRAEVYANSRLRLNCGGETGKTREKKNPNDNTPKYNHQIIDVYNDGCIEYTVFQNQHIGVVTRGIEGLPLGKSRITIYDSLNPNNEFTLWTRVTGNNYNHNAQNVYTYFDNTSSNNGPRRFLIIQDWMEINNIQEITVRVCPLQE